MNTATKSYFADRGKLIFLSLVLVLTGQVSARQKDAVGWLTIAGEKKFRNGWSVTGMNQYIFNQNYSELGLYFFDSGINFKYNDHWAISGNARLSNARNLDNFYENRTMIYSDLSYTKGFGKLGISVRTRLQRQYYGLGFAENTNRDPRNISRNKMTIRYRLDGYWTAYLNAELFYRFDKNVFNATRYGGGIYYQVNLHHRLEIYYLLQMNQHSSSPRNDYISGLSYAYRF